MKTRREFIKAVGGGLTGGLILRALPLGVGGALLSRPRRAHAGPIWVRDYTFPDPNTTDGSPDPSVWGRDGTLTPAPDAALGLGVIDPDNASKLLFFASPGVLGSETATFRVQVDTPPVSDNSSAWVNHALGWRLILDDGTSRLELALARDPLSTPPMRRVLRVENALNVALISFPWDNDFHNVYEIGRVASGASVEFVITAINKDPAATTQIPPVKILGSVLPGTSGAVFAWGTGLAGGGVSFWQEAHAWVSSALTAFATFAARAEIEQGPPGANKDEFEVKGSFTLGAGSNGINILTEIVSLELTGGAGGFSTTIPAGSFRMDKKGRFKFETIIDVGVFEAVIRPLGGNTFEFKAEGEGFNLGAIANPVNVSLTIGNDGGSIGVLAEISP